MIQVQNQAQLVLPAPSFTQSSVHCIYSLSGTHRSACAKELAMPTMLLKMSEVSQLSGTHRLRFSTFLCSRGKRRPSCSSSHMTCFGEMLVFDAMKCMSKVPARMSDSTRGCVCGTAQGGAAQGKVAQHSTAQQCTARHGTAPQSNAQHNTAEHSTAQMTSKLC